MLCRGVAFIDRVFIAAWFIDRWPAVSCVGIAGKVSVLDSAVASTFLEFFLAKLFEREKNTMVAMINGNDPMYSSEYFGNPIET
jgi:hypothetical protein